jgi:hypothetical protein
MPITANHEPRRDLSNFWDSCEDLKDDLIWDASEASQSKLPTAYALPAEEEVEILELTKPPRQAKAASKKDSWWQRLVQFWSILWNPEPPHRHEAAPQHELPQPDSALDLLLTPDDPDKIEDMVIEFLDEEQEELPPHTINERVNPVWEEFLKSL